MSSATEGADLYLGVSCSVRGFHGRSAVHLPRAFLVMAGICTSATYAILRDAVYNFRSHGSRLALVGVVAAAPFVT